LKELELVVHMAHQASNHHHSQQVQEEMPVDTVFMVVQVVASNHQAFHQEELVVPVVLMLLLLLSTVPIKTRMVLLMQMNLNNSIKVVYKELIFFIFPRFYIHCRTISFSFSLRKTLFLVIRIF
jgi:hypothetical protein